jgi:dCMP deaminase
MNRPDWTTYFMSIAYLISQRSIDESTKVGCVIVKDRSIISTGYNSAPSKMIDSQVPQTRPEKYQWMIHAEANAIANAAKIGASVKESTIYCTEIPCPRCMGLIINAGCSHVIYGNISAKINNQENITIARNMAKQAGIALGRTDKVKLAAKLFGELHDKLRTN